MSQKIVIIIIRMNKREREKKKENQKILLEDKKNFRKLVNKRFECPFFFVKFES